MNIIINNLDLINNKKKHINDLLTQINGDKEYGLYLVPDDINAFGHCDSISNGINWGGPHITIIGFDKDNNKSIPLALNHINAYGDKNKRWNPNKKAVKITSNNYEIVSSTLNLLVQFLTGKVNKLHNTFHLYCKNGVNQNPTFNGTTWSLIMIEKYGDNVKWIGPKIELYDITNLNTLTSKPFNLQSTQPKPIISKTNIKVLSYNISFQAMLGIQETSVSVACPMQGSHTQCLINVADFIESNGPFDFVGLQEATNWKDIISQSPMLGNMTHINNRPSCEDLTTFYNRDKYQLDSGINKIHSFMETHGRPFTILFFKQKICLINMHPDHVGDFYKLEQYLIDTLNDNRTTTIKGTTIPSKKFSVNNVQRKLDQSEIDEIALKLSTYEIIMMGDMNDQLGGHSSIRLFPHFVKPNGRVLYGINKTGSCCDSYLQTKLGSVGLAYDHILSTSNNIKTQVYNTKLPASDHLPIIANITL